MASPKNRVPLKEAGVYFGETHSFESKCQLVPFNFGQTFPLMPLSLMQRNACNPPNHFKIWIVAIFIHRVRYIFFFFQTLTLTLIINLSSSSLREDCFVFP